MNAIIIVLIPFYVLWTWKGKLKSVFFLLGGLIAVFVLLLTASLFGVSISPPIFEPRLYLCGYHIHHFIIASYAITLTHITLKTQNNKQILGHDKFKSIFSPWMGFWALVWISEIPYFILEGINPLYP